jgi:hypothetical protein
MFGKQLERERALEGAKKEKKISGEKATPRLVPTPET